MTEHVNLFETAALCDERSVDPDLMADVRAGAKRLAKGTSSIHDATRSLIAKYQADPAVVEGLLGWATAEAVLRLRVKQVSRSLAEARAWEQSNSELSDYFKARAIAALGPILARYRAHQASVRELGEAAADCRVEAFTVSSAKDRDRVASLIESCDQDATEFARLAELWEARLGVATARREGAESTSRVPPDPSLAKPLEGALRAEQFLRRKVDYRERPGQGGYTLAGLQSDFAGLGWPLEEYIDEMHLALSPIAHISDHFERFVYLNSRSQRDSPESLLRDASVPVEVNRVLVEGDVVKIAATAPSPQQIERARSALSGHGRDGGHKRAVLSAGDYSADVAALSLAILTSFANHHPDRALVLNLWVDSIDRATGHDKRVCVLTVASASSTVLALNLEHVEPTACVKALGASTSRSSKELAPVRPIIAFDKVDARFVEPSDVRAALDSRPNLLELTPGEFESLIENLFRAIGLDTHLTRASRDGGVDCVAYDHRPVFGGKVVIQAKRYSRVVGVSAVRDLFGATHNEGANKGILVTTSHYGKASYEFAANKPLELIDGSALLYLLKEHLETEAKIVVPSDWVDPSDD